MYYKSVHKTEMDWRAKRKTLISPYGFDITWKVWGKLWRSDRYCREHIISAYVNGTQCPRLWYLVSLRYFSTYDFKKSLRYILGYHWGVAENSSRLGCYDASAGKELKDVEKDRKAFLDCLTQKIKALWPFETSAQRSSLQDFILHFTFHFVSRSTCKHWELPEDVTSYDSQLRKGAAFHINNR